MNDITTWRTRINDAMSAKSRAVEAAVQFSAKLEDAARAAEAEPGPVVASMYAQIKGAVEELDAELTTPHNLVNRFKYTLVPSAFDREGVKTITTEDGYRVTVNPELRASMVDKQLAFDWLRANGLEDLITPTVNASTLKASLRAKLADDGIEPPPEAIKVEVGFTTSVTKVAKKG